MVQSSGSQLGTILSPREHLAISGEFLIVTPWHLVGRG